MATDVHRRGHGRTIEGLSVVAGAAHLLPADGKSNSPQPASLRGSYQQYVGVISAPADAASGQLTARRKPEGFGPKLVQGDYTYTTSRKNLMVSSQFVGGGSLQPGATSAAPSAVPSTTSVGALRGTIPAMVPMNAGNINTAAWKAYGSPSARNHSRPPLAPSAGGGGGGGGGVAGAVGGAVASPGPAKLPRVGGFKPRRPQSAPGMGGGNGGDLGPAIAAIASTVSIGAAARRAGKVPDTVDVGVLAVEHVDPIRAGRTDSGKIMFEHTLPTDPYAKYMWEEQARKARANMSRHIAAMAAAAAVNGGNAFQHGGGSGYSSTAAAGAAFAASATGGSGGGGSRPGSAVRGGVSGTAQSPSAGPTVTGAAALAGAAGSRPRFCSTPLADVARQGTDYKPPTVLGFAAPDLTEDGTMPGPGDPRWAYTRMGRTQIERLQNSLKMVSVAPSRANARPASAPALGGAGGAAGATGTYVASGLGGGQSAGVGIGVGTDNSLGGVGVSTGVGSPERSLARAELSVLDPFSDPTQGGTAAAVAVAAGAGGSPLAAQRSSPMRSGSGSGAMRAGSNSGLVRPGSAGLIRPASASYGRTGALSGNLARSSSHGLGLPRPGSAGLIRPTSASASGAAAMLGVGSSAANLAAAMLAEASGSPAVPPVRGASAGRTREAAPNPRVDLRMYLAEAEADAEEDDEGTEMLPVGDLYDGGMAGAAVPGGGVLVGADGLPVPAAVLQSMPVPADQLAARLAEMVAAVAVVAAQKQIDGDEHQPRVRIEETDDDGRDLNLDLAAEKPVNSVPEPDFAVGRDSVPPAPSVESPVAPAPSLQTRFSRPEGDDALLALHGSSNFGARRSGSHSGVGEYGRMSALYDNEGGVGEWDSGSAPPPMEQPLGLGVGLGPRPGKGPLGSGSGSSGFGSGSGSGAGRPTSARPMSARPTSARPTSAMPVRRSGSPVRGLGEGGLDGGMDVIMEQSEGTLGEDC